MIMDTVLDLDHTQAMQKLSKKARQQEWEKYVSKFQETTEETSAGDLSS